ncbi:hypothetical protein ACFVUH_20355 [Kitasatospora sp. NPDC058032]|uniref:hypothetical protein n=1 Tax=Kitasatospora sp. NPDC058032 TaxID=3346307 RepID=UPI0036DBF87B
MQTAAAYCTDGATPLGADEYDELVRVIVVYQEAHPGEVPPDSPGGKAAGGAVAGDLPHSAPMLSLDNVFSAEELDARAAGLERRPGRPAAGRRVEPKLDGLTPAARYRAGRLHRLITRLDGLAGEDTSRAADAVPGPPPGAATTATTIAGPAHCAGIDEVQQRVEESAALRAAPPFGTDRQEGGCERTR